MLLNAARRGGLAALVLAIAAPADAGAAPLALLVPAYANPCCGDGPAMWSRLTASAAALGGDLWLVLNPASGPGASPIDPNYVDAGGAGPLIDFRAAGGGVVGYVATGYATRSLAVVEAEIDLYYTPSYWRGAGIQVDGIFFDEMSNDLAQVGYYQALRDHVRSLDPAAWIVGNPGTSFVDNPSAQTTFTVADYAAAADTLMTFESAGLAYRDAYEPPSWLGTVPPAAFAHVVHSESAASLLTDLGLALRRDAGFVYLTDDVLPNPYDTLSTYWETEAEAAVHLLFADGFESGDVSAW